VEGETNSGEMVTV